MTLNHQAILDAAYCEARKKAKCWQRPWLWVTYVANSIWYAMK